MALLIVASHLPVFVGWSWIKPLHDLGAPIVSVFLFISGYGLVKSYGQRGGDYLTNFFSRRVFRVFLPSVVAMALFYCFNWNRDTDVLGDINNMIRYGDTVLPFSWFVIVIILFYTMFYLVYRLVRERWRLPVIFVLVLMFMAATIAAGYDRCWWVCSLAFPAGMVFSKYSEPIFGFCSNSSARYISILVLLTIITALLFYRWPQNQYVCAVCYVFIAMLVVLIAAKLPVENLNKPLVMFLASISYEIYLCQGIPMYFFAGKVPIANRALYILVVYLVTALLAYAVHSFCVVITADKAK